MNEAGQAAVEVKRKHATQTARWVHTHRAVVAAIEYVYFAAKQ